MKVFVYKIIHIDLLHKLVTDYVCVEYLGCQTRFTTTCTVGIQCDLLTGPVASDHSGEEDDSKDAAEDNDLNQQTDGGCESDEEMLFSSDSESDDSLG